MCKGIVIALIVSATIIVLTGIVSKTNGNMYVVINVKPPRIVIKKKNS